MTYSSTVERIDPVVKARWIEALRSNRYPQTTGSLHRTKPSSIGFDYLAPIGFCCLGVLCEVAIEHFDIHITKEESSGQVEEYDGMTGLPPEKVAMLVGHDATFNPHLFVATTPDSPEHYFYLTNLNDSGFTFDQIADVINYFL